MSLNLNPDALAATRDTLLKREARNTPTKGNLAGPEDRATFADQLRASQRRADQAERPQDVQKNQPTDRDNGQTFAPPVPKDQSDVRPSQTAKTETDASLDDEAAGVAPEAESETAKTAASEAVMTETAGGATETTAQITPEQALAALTAQQDKAASTDPTAEIKPADLISDTQVGVLAQALNTLKSALKDQVGDKAASASETDTADAATDAQLEQLMQALLSGKPLAPELKALSETPKVAEALKAVGKALSALDQKGLESGKALEAALAFALKSENVKAKTSIEVKPADRKPDPSLDLPGAIATTSQVVSNAQASAGQVDPETVMPQTASAELANAKRLAAKSSELSVDVKPVSTPAETTPLMPAQASAKAADALQLTRTEAALGSGLSTTALNNLTQMSAQIARHMTAKSTQFNMELHPADMGRVDVKLSIGHDGSLRAALSFDSPVAESQFRAQADDLRRQLESHGFQLAEGSLSFSSRQNSDQPNQGQAFADNAPAFADEAPDAARATQAFGAFDQTSDATVPGALLAQKLGLDLLGAQTYRLSLNVTA